MTLSTQSITDDAQEIFGDVRNLRHALHREPEVGLYLPSTQEKVLNWLEPLGYELSLGKDLSSVTAVLRGGAAKENAPTVLLRGDMDGLPVKEKTGVDYASQTGDTMHACGHDMHVAMLAGAATLLAERKEQLPGDVVLMFQPGEEGFDGAGHMIREGVLDAAGKRADVAYGIHVMSGIGTNGEIMSRPGAIMSASDGLYVTVRGKGGHGSAPFMAKDPVGAAAEMVTALQMMVTRNFDAFDPVVISVGVFNAGNARNVIPETAHFEATIRSFSPQAHDKLQCLVPLLLQGIAKAHGLEVEIDYRPEYPVTANHAENTNFARSAAIELFGDACYTEMAQPLTGSEDFSRVLQEVPGAFIFLSALAPGETDETAQYNHSPYAHFDDSVLSRGTALYTYLATRSLTELSAH
ncbi:amidohydrolase [Glutamicibacter uratoxydans]|uniref:Amidohydrolase n=1 Tax=Glutamicibacter uratoxydans TaxID=43667 RepID=A0A4Y4DTN2_GLUUR|nr:M20 family metallopeptidase [Glutamicibacter uratoxydans]GED05841.1 amidohydrolase [Glutamicibacter uratoxydans]